MFYDQAKIYVRAGNGGNGLASFRREKYVPFGGPDGGDGGHGGHVYLAVDPGLNTLLPFHYQQRYPAENGGNGRKSKKHGKQGADRIVKVPPGTVVYDDATGEQVADLVVPGSRVRVARGGKGGLGNPHFATSTHQAPRLAEKGEPGEERWLRLELKLIADVGLAGYPNAGKSTLISAISAARPKIADYPFTTLEPNLGVVEVEGETFVVADIPGLIEGAHRGVGLGHEFLRHIERTRVLIQVIDASGQEGRDPVDDFRIITAELLAHDPALAQRPRIVALNKIDMPEAQANRARLEEMARAEQLPVYAISAATNQGLRPLLFKVVELLRANPRPALAEPAAEPTTYTLEQDEKVWHVERLSRRRFRVTGGRIERLVRMTDFNNEEAVARLQRVLKASGISDALTREEVQPGDVVHIADHELIWDEEAYEEQQQARAAEKGR